MTDIFGKPLSLDEFKGKVVLLNFWATWCSPCRTEIPRFVDLMGRYRQRGLMVIGISMDDNAPPVVQFCKDLKVNYPVALGNDRLAALYGGIMSLPVTFLIDREGRISARHYGELDLTRVEPEVRQLLEGSDSPAFLKPQGAEAGGDTHAEGFSDVGSEVPGISLVKLTPAQKKAFLAQLNNKLCPCDCKLTLLKCRQEDHQCGFSLKLARQQLAEVLKSKQ